VTIRDYDDLTFVVAALVMVGLLFGLTLVVVL